MKAESPGPCSCCPALNLRWGEGVRAFSAGGRGGGRPRIAPPPDLRGPGSGDRPKHTQGHRIPALPPGSRHTTPTESSESPGRGGGGRARRQLGVEVGHKREGGRGAVETTWGEGGELSSPFCATAGGQKGIARHSSS